MTQLCNGLLGRIQLALVSLRRDEGQTFTEYALILAVLATGVIASVGALRDALIDALTAAAGDI